ncbi:MAG: hypothetical protein WBL65_17395 [Bryobacteraceae bacterium]
MRGLLIVLMSATLAATTGFAQSRHGSGGGRSFAGGGYSRGFVGSNRGYVGVGRAYAGGYYGGYGYGAYGYGYGYGLGYPAYYGPSCYSPYYYGAYNCGYPIRGYYTAPMARMVVPRGVMAPRAGVIVGGGWRRFGRR